MSTGRLDTDAVDIDAVDVNAIDIDAVFAWLRSLEITVCAAETVHKAMLATRPLRGWLDVMDARIRARDRELRLQILEPADESRDEPPDPPGEPPPPPNLPEAPVGSGSSANPIDGPAGVGHGEGRRRDRASLIIERFVGLDFLLAAGVITSDHVHTISRALHNLDPRVDALIDQHREEIVAVTSRSSCTALRRYLTQVITRISAECGVEAPLRRRRSTLRHWVDRSTGQAKVLAELNPEDYQRFTVLLNAATQQIAASLPGCEREEIAAVALLGLLGAGDGPSISARAVVSMSVIVDAETLSCGPHASSLCEYADGTPINPSELPRLACTADRIPIVVGDGVPLNVGRTQRLATAAQHRAIEAIHSTCAVDGCTTPVTMCELHHVHHWEHGGPTDLANLIPLCSYHHHRTHEQQWQIQVSPDRTVTTISPQGVTHHARPDRIAS
jgi:hypothetical protein